MKHHEAYIRMAEVCEKCGKELRSSPIFKRNENTIRNHLFMAALSNKKCCGKLEMKTLEVPVDEIVRLANEVPGLKLAIKQMGEYASELRRDEI